jgi:hypothetical protein
MAFQAHQLLSGRQRSRYLPFTSVDEAKNYSITRFATSTGRIGVASQSVRADDIDASLFWLPDCNASISSKIKNHNKTVQS